MENNIITVGEEYYYVEKRGNTLIAGTACNTGIIPIVEIDYDEDDSFDGNLTRLYDELMYQMRECPVCGKLIHKDNIMWTYDCHGIAFRPVCSDCWYEIMENGKGYDGEYYTEADECIDWDY